MMPRSFLVKKRDELMGQISLDSNGVTSAESPDVKDMDNKTVSENQQNEISNCEKKSTILKIPNEINSLHKFTIARMLEIPSVANKKEDLSMCSDSIYSKNERSPETVDENCNKVENCDKTQESAFDLRMKPPAEAVAMTDARQIIQGRGDAKANNRSPNGSPSEPPKLFDHFPWQTSLFSGISPALSSYFPVGLPFHGPSASLPFTSLSDKHFPIKPYPDPLMAFSSIRTYLPNPRFMSGSSMPFYSNSEKAYPTSAKIPESQYQGKLLNSAFDPVISKFVYSRENIPMELDLTTSGKKKEKEGEPTRYHCDGCTKVYATFSGLSKHKQFHCSSQVKKEFSCKYCEKTYVSLGALKMHIRTHTLPCKCKLCGKAFSRPWLLQGHIRTHTGEKPFRCDHCARAFADRSNLRAHLQTHSDIKKYSCKTCSKTFSRMSLLLKHEDGCCGGSPLS